MRQDRTVYRRSDGTWANQRDSEKSPETTHESQHEAISAARWFLRNHATGGGITVRDAMGNLERHEEVTLN